MPFANAVQYAPALFLEQVVIALEPVEEVDVEAVVECVGRIRPLGHHESLRVFLLQQLANLAPEEFRCVLVSVEELLVASHPPRLDQGTRHVGTESVGPHVHPEAQHILQVLTHSQHVGVVGRQLPLLSRVGIGKAEVQRGLAPVEVAHELPVALAIALYELSGKLHRGIHPVGFRPDVVV